MADPTLALIGDLLVAPLLAAVVYYAIKLHRRLQSLRAEQQQLSALIGEFASAADRADHASERLKSAGVDTEKSVRTLLARGESLRDELAFLIERADQASTRVGEAARRAPVAAANRPPVPANPDPGPSPAAPRSEAERALIHAMRQANGR